MFGLFHVELTSEVRDLGDYCTRKIKLSPISNVCPLNPNLCAYIVLTLSL